jgi:hypothetical protein
MRLEGWCGDGRWGWDGGDGTVRTVGMGRTCQHTERPERFSCDSTWLLSLAHHQLDVEELATAHLEWSS